MSFSSSVLFLTSFDSEKDSSIYIDEEDYSDLFTDKFIFFSDVESVFSNGLSICESLSLKVLD